MLNIMSYGNCKLNHQWHITVHLLDWQNSEKLIIPNAGEGMEQKEFSFNPSRNAKWCTTLEDRLAVSYWVKTQLNWKPKATNNLYMNIYSSFFHNCPRLEASKMSFNRRMDKLWYKHTIDIIQQLKKKIGAPGWLSWLSVQLLILAHVMISQFVR